MNSGRDRDVLEGIERDLRATDPELCDRLSRVDDVAGPVRSALRRSIGTRAILGYLAVLSVALLLGLTGLVLLMFVATVISVSARAVRARPGVPEAPPGMGDDQPSGTDGRPAAPANAQLARPRSAGRTTRDDAPPPVTPLAA